MQISRISFEYINQITKNMQVLFLAILVFGAYLAYTKIAKKPKNQEAEAPKAEPVVEVKAEEAMVEVKAEEPVAQVETVSAVIEEVKPAAKKVTAKKPVAKKPAAKKAPVKKPTAKAETTKAKKAKK
jgi:hypothetical protein